MYKLLIVDDEKIEREGMERFIQWEKRGIELVGSAWNGLEGFEKIQEKKPDIVLTDIKMPVMDGIELIRKVKKSFPEIEFVVLSGYGEYEFTSKAMEEGVRYYILKPCDEQKITEVLDKVKADIEGKRENLQEKEYQNAALKLLPRAKEQIFRNMLLGREQPKRDYQLIVEEIGGVQEVIVLAFRMQNGFDDLEQFVIGNILSDLLGNEKVFLSTSIQKDVLLLLDAKTRPNIESAVARTRKVFMELETLPIQAAVSNVGKVGQVSALYLQAQGLFKIGSMEQQIGFLHEDLFKNLQNDATLLVDYHRIRNAKEYAEVLFEIYLMFVKMELKQYTFEQKKEICQWMLHILYGDEAVPKNIGVGDRWVLLEQVVNLIAEKQGLGLNQGKEEQRIKRILLTAYQNLQNPEMNIQYLSQKVLFMNEDYFGRVFAKNRNERFSAFLVKQKIALAQRLLQYNTELKIARLAEIVGYPSDGQYFSKEFRKIIGVSPTEYRDALKKSSFFK